MSKKIFLFALMVLALPLFGFAEEKTIMGEVIDVSCYVVAGAKGMEHKACGMACLQAGEPAGILDEKTGKVYLVITEDHKTKPQDKVIPFVAKKVEVTGNISERSGINVIDIKSIKEMGSEGMQKREEMPKEKSMY